MFGASYIQDYIGYLIHRIGGFVNKILGEISLY
jgi:hypothetical protein